MALILKSVPSRHWLTIGENNDGVVNIEIADSALHEVCDYKINKDEAIQVISKLQLEFNL
jgi:hypothetical protein